MQSILRRQDVEKVTGLAKPTIYQLIKKGEFPRQVKITGRAVGWLESEILAWQKTRIANRDREAA